jgi:hypothetical protein
MKKLKTFSSISCFVMVLSFLIFSFSYIAVAKETPETNDARIENCISNCTKQQLACLNLNPDRRLCAAENENCVAACKSEGTSPSSRSESYPSPK